MSGEGSRPAWTVLLVDWHWAAIPLALVFLLLIVDFATDADRALTRLVFDPASDAFPLRDSFWLEVVLHHWTKYVVITLACLVVAGWLLSWLLPALGAERRVLLFLALALTVAPAGITVAKAISGKHCPWDIDEFGGLVPYTRLLETRPASLPPGRCFPAGHASTGYALMAFYFAARARRMAKFAYVALAAGIAAGTLLGLGRVLQGAHFVTHVLWSGVICWSIMVVLYMLVLTRPGADLARAPSRQPVITTGAR
jgi:membrane-associated PAP2 superfamily phosphatase